jgi:hypothetical protein
LFVYLNAGNGFDNGKQWQSDLGGGEDWKNRPCLPLTCLSLVGGKDWKNRPMHRNGEYSMLIDIPKLLCHCLPLSKPLPVLR